MLSRQLLGGRVDSRELGRDAGLVADVELQQDGGKGLDRRGIGQLAGIERPAAGDLADDVADRADRVRIVASRSARRSRSVRRCVRARSPGGGGTRRRRGSAARPPARGRRHCPAAGRSGWNSLFTRTSALAMRTTILPASCGRRAPAPSSAAESHGVAITTRSQSAATGVVAVAEPLGELRMADRSRRGSPSPGTSTASRSPRRTRYWPAAPPVPCPRAQYPRSSRCASPRPITDGVRTRLVTGSFRSPELGCLRMGLLDGKKIVITGVLTDASLAYGVARHRHRRRCRDRADRRRAGAVAHPAHGTQARRRHRRVRVRRHGPRPRRRGARRRGSQVGPRRRRAARDRVRPAVVPRRRVPRRPVGGRRGRDADLDVLVEDARRRVRAADGHGGSFVGLDFDNQPGVAGLQLDGRRQVGAAERRRYLARELGPLGIRCNLVAAGPMRTMAAKSIPGFALFEDIWDDRAPLGWDVNNSEPVAKACVALLSDWFPATTGEIIHVDGGFHSTGAAGRWARLDVPAVNRLADETSPYLRQHRDNPVDWYPWGAEAFAAAEQRNVPILLSRRLLGLPLVPRDGPRVLRGRRGGGGDERDVRQHQGRPRGAARRRRHVHGRRAGADRTRRLADDGVHDARRPAVLRRHVLSQAAVPGAADRRVDDAWRNSRDDARAERRARSSRRSTRAPRLEPAERRARRDDV